jgi:hypothetical protein
MGRTCHANSTKGVYSVPVSEAIHVARPPEHRVEPIKPLSREALLLGSVGEQFKKAAETLYHDILSDEALRARAVEAQKFSFDLNGFWQYSRDSANNSYRFDKSLDKGWLDRTESSLKDIDKTLATQLAKWEEVTSPFSDHYDIPTIYDTAHELRTTIERGLENIKPPIGIPAGAQDAAEVAYRYSLSSALAGLSEQISSRLSALAAGKAELGTLKRQTNELAERAAKDKIGESIVTEANDAQRLQSDFNRNSYTAEKLTTLWTRRLDLELELARKDLTADKRQEVQQEHAKVARDLEVFETGLDLADFPASRKRELRDLRTEIWSQHNAILKGTGYSATELQAKKVKRDRFVTDLVGKESPLLKQAGTAVADAANEARDRRELYEQQLEDAKTAAYNDPAGYWRDIKGTFLEGVEAVSGKELRKTLDSDAFDSKLANQLNDWNRELKRTRPDPTRLQELAINLEATMIAYSQRADVALRKEARGADAPLPKGDRDALRQAGDALQVGLAALRQTMARNLKFLVEAGTFN